MEKKKLIIYILSSAVVITLIISAIVYSNSKKNNGNTDVETEDWKESQADSGQTSDTGLTEASGEQEQTKNSTTGQTTDSTGRNSSTAKNSNTNSPTTSNSTRNSSTPGSSTNNSSSTAPQAGPGSGTAQTSNSSFVQQVIDLVNSERAKAGLTSVTTNTGQASAASLRAQEIISDFSHTRPNGSSFSTALDESGVSYRGAGENIAYGQTTPQQVMNGWMNSSGHKANILNANYRIIGVGYCQNASGTAYWTQLFAY